MQKAILISSILSPLVAAIAFYIVYFKIKGSIEHGYNKQMQELVGEISKNNTLLHTTVQSYLTSSEKIDDKKIEAYSLLWKSVQEVKEFINPEMNFIYNALRNDEIINPRTFNRIGRESSIVEYSTLEVNDIVDPIFDISKEVSLYRPFISDEAFKLFIVIQLFVGRVRHKFIIDYTMRELYDWKSDEVTVNLLREALSKEEIDHILKLNVYSLRSLIDIIELKIIQATKQNLNISHSTEDSIQHVRSMENIFNSLSRERQKTDS